MGQPIHHLRHHWQKYLSATDKKWLHTQKPLQWGMSPTIFSIWWSESLVICKFEPWTKGCCGIAQVTKTKTTSFGIFPIDIACHSPPVPKLSDDCATLFPYVSDVTGATRGWQWGDVVNCCEWQMSSHFVWLLRLMQICWLTDLWSSTLYKYNISNNMSVGCVTRCVSVLVV